MATKLDLKEWVVEAIKAHGGVAHAIDIAKFIWVNYHEELQGAGDLFYTWQQEVQWAIVDLRREGRVLAKSKGQKGPVRLRHHEQPPQSSRRTCSLPS